MSRWNIYAKEGGSVDSSGPTDWYMMGDYGASFGRIGGDAEARLESEIRDLFAERHSFMKRTILPTVIVGCAAMLVTAACNSSESQRAPAPAATTAPPATPAPPKMPDVGIYVTNETSGNLTVIDAATLTPVTTIALGKRPRGIAASPDGSRLYVALSGSPNAGPGVDEKTLPPPDRKADGIGVVDLDQGKLVKVLTSGPDPEQLAVSPDGAHVYIANEDGAKLSVVDVNTGEIAESFNIGEEPEGVSIEPHNGRVWVTSEEDGAVYVIDVAGHKVVKPVKVGPRPRSVAFLPDGSRAYVPSENGATLSMIDVKKLATVKTINLGTGMRPMGTVVSSDGAHLYVTTGRSKMLLILDTAKNDVVGSIEAGPRPWGIALSADGSTAYTANGPSNDISVIDLANKAVTKKIAVGTGPWGIALVRRSSAR